MTVVRSIFELLRKHDPPSYSGLSRRFDRFSRNYLLDTMDLNTKCRCVYSWAGEHQIISSFVSLLSSFECLLLLDTDPKNDAGFKALPDDHTFPVDVVLKSRQEFFKDAEIVSQSALKSFLASTRLLYAEKKENRSNIRYGLIFMTGTVLLDWLICAI
jgi:hypothetical protein